MPRILGIDIGTHAVKIAILEGGFGRFRLADYRVRAVPQQIDEPPNPQRRLAALGALMEEIMSSGGKQAGRIDPVVGFPTEQGTLRLVRLPFADRTQVEKTFPFEVEGQVPFELDEMLVSSRITQLKAADSRVFAFLVPRVQVRAFLDGLSEAGVDPRGLVVDIDPLSHFADTGVQAVVDIGHERTILALCRDGKVIGGRTLHGGGRDLTLALARESNLSWEEAEGRKHVARLPVALPATVEWEDDDTTSPLAHDRPEAGEPRLEPDPRDGEVLLDVLRPLLAEMRASLIALEDLHEVEIEEIRLVGGTAALDGLVELLTEELGVPVRRPPVSDLADRLGEPTRFALAHALGELAANRARHKEFDLRCDEFAYRGDLTQLGNIARWGGVAAVILLVASVGWFAWRTTRLEHQLATVDAQIVAKVQETFPNVPADRLKTASAALAIMTEKTQAMTSRVETLAAILSDAPPTLGLLKELSDAMPPPSEARVDVRELTVTDSSIRLKAETDGFEAATKIESSLQARPEFKEAQKGDETKIRDGVRFTITIPRKSTDEETSHG